jgi:putative ABC transport system permease protein
MTRLREWMQRLWGSIRPNSRELEMEEELRQHLELAREGLQSRGIAADDIQRALRIEHGGLTQTMESMRDQRGLPWLDDFACDLRYGLRSLRRSPGFTALAVFIMVLGIGANTAVFSVVNAVLLKPLSYHNPDRIVTITNPLTTGERSSPLAVRLVSIPNFQDWHDQSSYFEAMAFYYSWKNPAMAGSTAEYAQVTKVSPEFFRVFAVEPAVGRFFNAEESKPGSGGALMISYAYWQSHFGGEPGVLGRTIRRYNSAQAIAGVLPPGFRFPDDTDLWTPDTDNGASMSSRDSQNRYVIGRLKSGVSLEQAQTEMTGITRRLEQQYPETNENLTAVVTRLRDEMVGDIRFTLFLLLGAVGVVLLIACANTATLLLGRATVRNREIAVRASLGASQWRIGRQLFSESLLLAFLAGAVGLLLAYGGSKALIALAPAGLPRLSETRVDHSVLLFTAGAWVLTSLLFGLLPGLYASKIDLNDALKQAGTRSVTGRGWSVCVDCWRSSKSHSRWCFSRRQAC